MKTVLVGYSRLYNARGCSLLGNDEALLRFSVGAIEVEAYVGPTPRYSVAVFKIGPAEPKDPAARSRSPRGKEYDLPLRDNYPADIYTELVAKRSIDVDDALAEAFHGRDKAAQAEILRRAKEQESSLISAIDYVAGVLGLRVHSLLVRTPITEQSYAYRDKGAPYALRVALRVEIVGTHDWDVSDEGLSETKSRMPVLRKQWTWESASEVLAWLLRAWATEDPVVKFVSLFIPLESVIPEVPRAGRDAWDHHRSALLVLVEEEATAPDRKELSKFLTDLRPPPNPLNSRFKYLATEAALPGWKNDVTAFTEFNRMRNQLVHAGNKRVKPHVTVAAGDVRTLEDIAARYVSLALFGDANLYRIPKHIPP
jgi:hypothetical protein